MILLGIFLCLHNLFGQIVWLIFVCVSVCLEMLFGTDFDQCVRHIYQRGGQTTLTWRAGLFRCYHTYFRFVLKRWCFQCVFLVAVDRVERPLTHLQPPRTPSSRRRRPVKLGIVKSAYLSTYTLQTRFRIVHRCLSMALSLKVCMAASFVCVCGDNDYAVRSRETRSSSLFLYSPRRSAFPRAV